MKPVLIKSSRKVKPIIKQLNALDEHLKTRAQQFQTVDSLDDVCLCLKCTQLGSYGPAHNYAHVNILIRTQTN